MGQPDRRLQPHTTQHSPSASAGSSALLLLLLGALSTAGGRGDGGGVPGRASCRLLAANRLTLLGLVPSSSMAKLGCALRAAWDGRRLKRPPRARCTRGRLQAELRPVRQYVTARRLAGPTGQDARLCPDLSERWQRPQELHNRITEHVRAAGRRRATQACWGAWQFAGAQLSGVPD